MVVLEGFKPRQTFERTLSDASNRHIRIGQKNSQMSPLPSSAAGLLCGFPAHMPSEYRPLSGVTSEEPANRGGLCLLIAIERGGRLPVPILQIPVRPSQALIEMAEVACVRSTC